MSYQQPARGFPARLPINRFPAAFDSNCEWCASRIYEGDEIGYIDNDVACEDCCDDEDRERKRECL